MRDRRRRRLHGRLPHRRGDGDPDARGDPHRGPDDGGTLVLAEDRVGLGHRRLSIIDLSPAGHQPMAQRGRLGVDHLQRRGLQPRRAARGARGQRPPLPLAAPTRRRSSTSTRRRVPTASSAWTACSRFAIWDAPPARAVPGARPRRRQAALLRAPARRPRSSGPRSRRCSSTPPSRATSTRSAFFDYLTFAFTPAPRHDVRGHLQAGAGRMAAGPRRRIDPARDLLGPARARAGPRRGMPSPSSSRRRGACWRGRSASA